MNARGIPTAAYQLLHLLSYPGGYPIPGQEEPHTWLQGYPILDWGTPRKRPGTSHWGTPRKDMGPVEVLWDGDGVSPERTWDQWKYYGMEMGYPPGVWTDKQTENITFPILRMRAVNVLSFEVFTIRSKLHFKPEFTSGEQKQTRNCLQWGQNPGSLVIYSDAHTIVLPDPVCESSLSDSG